MVTWPCPYGVGLEKYYRAVGGTHGWMASASRIVAGGQQHHLERSGGALPDAVGVICWRGAPLLHPQPLQRDRTTMGIQSDDLSCWLASWLMIIWSNEL